MTAGHRGDASLARAALTDAQPAVRAAALGALARSGHLTSTQLRRALGDPAPAVRRRAAQEAVPVLRRPAPTVGARATPSLHQELCRALADADPLVVEMACWALGELEASTATTALASVARSHPDARCREAAVAALGSLGDPDGRAAVLGALEDRPSVRRRAVVALAAFRGPEVDEALRRSLEDRDWQVRQAAEILLEET